MARQMDAIVREIGAVVRGVETRCRTRRRDTYGRGSGLVLGDGDDGRSSDLNLCAPFGAGTDGVSDGTWTSPVFTS